MNETVKYLILFAIMFGAAILGCFAFDAWTGHALFVENKTLAGVFGATAVALIIGAVFYAKKVDLD